MQEIKLFEHQATNGKFVVGKVYYSLGGANYFSGGTEARGYYFSITPEERSETMITRAAFSGTRILIREATRFSRKILESTMPSEEQIKSVLANVLQKNKLELLAESIKAR